MCQKTQQKINYRKCNSYETDKGKTIVIINSDVYSEKVNAFLSASNFKTLPKDPTDKFQKTIHKTMQECYLIIDKSRINHITQKKKNFTQS
jgi:archaellin